MSTSPIKSVKQQANVGDFGGEYFELVIFGNHKTGKTDAILTCKTEILGDKGWSREFGKVERVLEAVRDLGGLNIDLRKCTWADPIPMMSVLLLSARLMQHSCTVKWQLRRPTPQVTARPPSRSSEAAQHNPRRGGSGGRLLRFLREEGFIAQALDSGVVLTLTGDDARIEITDPSALAQHLDSREDLAYAESTLIPVRLLQLPVFSDAGRESIAAEVSQYLDRNTLTEKIESEVDHRSTEGLISTLRLVLTEALINVVEHAYLSNDRARYAAFYVRLRRGMHSANQAERTGLRLFLQTEHIDSPRLDDSFLLDRHGCIEVYVSDGGCGLVEGLRSAHPSLHDAKFPFPSYVRRVLQDGLSRNVNRRTSKGALSLIYSNATRRGDYLRCYGDGWWLGTPCPMPDETYAVHELLAKVAENAPAGLHWHFRLAWDGPTDQDESWYFPGIGSPQHAAFLQGYGQPLTPQLRSLISSLDLRNGPNAERFSHSPYDYVLDERPRHFVWVTGRSLLKNAILKRVQEIATALDADATRTLHIVNIPRHEAGAYLWALKDLTLDQRHDWPLRFARIVLVTAGWKVCVLIREKMTESGQDSPYPEGASSLVGHAVTSKHRYLFSAKETHDFWHVKSTSPDAPEIYAADLVAVLKWHASAEFWRAAISVSEHEPIYFNGSVQWGDQVISGYVDIGRAVQIATCRRVLLRELRRFCLALGRRHLALHSFDTYAASIVTQVDWEVAVPEPARPIRLGVGSVLATGTTLLAHSSDRESSVHFFVHSEAKRNELEAFRSLLFWPADEAWLDARFPRSPQMRRRIGKTGAISDKGGETYELPRYDGEGRPVSARHPRDSYADFQRAPAFVRTGHWSNGAHHDVLTPSVRRAISRSRIDGAGAVIYVGACIVKALQVPDAALTEKGRQAMLEVDIKLGSRTEFGTRACAVVYPAQSDANFLIESALEFLLTPLWREKIKAQIIGVANIRAASQRLPLLASPSAADRIRQLLRESRGRSSGTVVLVDDAVITGKTSTELISFLTSLGASKVAKIALLDRQRLPSGTATPNDVYAYWRLDLPPIGDRHNCPVCSALNELAVLERSLCSSQLRAHVARIRTRWLAVDPNREWSMALPPVQIPEVELEYGTSGLSSAVPKTVLVRTSTAAALWHIELETMTGAERKLTAALPAATLVDEDGVASDNLSLVDLAYLEIAGAMIFYFLGSSVPGRKAELLEAVFRLVLATRNSGAHTSFALLAIMSGLGEIRLLGREFAERLVTQHIPDDADALSDDSRALLSALLVHRILPPTDNKLTKITRLLSASALPLATLYNVFHYELLSPLGTPHGRPLAKIAEGVAFSSEDEASTIREALDSCDFIIDFSHSVPPSRLRSSDASRDGRDQDSPLASALLSALREDCIRARTGLEGALTSSTGLASAAGPCKRLLASARRLRGRLFVNLKDVERLFRAASAERDGKRLRFCPVLMQTNLRPDEERWLVWDSEVHRTVGDLAGNALRYGKGTTKDPWGSSASGPEAQVWCAQTYTDRGLILKIANKIRGPSELQAIEIKGAIRFAHVRAFGGTISWSAEHSNSELVGVVAIFLPYSGLCHTEE